MDDFSSNMGIYGERLLNIFFISKMSGACVIQKVIENGNVSFGYI